MCITGLIRENGKQVGGGRSGDWEWREGKGLLQSRREWLASVSDIVGAGGKVEGHLVKTALNRFGGEGMWVEGGTEKQIATDSND